MGNEEEENKITKNKIRDSAGTVLSGTKKKRSQCLARARNKDAPPPKKTMSWPFAPL